MTKTRYVDREVSVGIVEDDELTRERLRARVDAAASLTCIFAVATVAEANDQMVRCKPGVLLVDLRLPDGDGVEVLTHMREHLHSTVALVISTLGNEESVTRAIKAGALGYLLKDDSEEMIERSIRQLLNGGSPISPAIARHLIRHFQPAKPPVAPNRKASNTLTPREADVLMLAAKGYSYQEVAELLGVTTNTVSSYTKKIYEKLAVNSRNEALFEATRLGLVVPPEPEQP